MKIRPPKNQHDLVMVTLIELGKGVMTCVKFAQEYNILKWSTRLAEIEEKINTVLVKRTVKKFTNRYGHTSHYTEYRSIMSKKEYIKLYEKLNAIK